MPTTEKVKIFALMSGRSMDSSLIVDGTFTLVHEQTPTGSVRINCVSRTEVRQASFYLPETSDPD